MTRSAGWLALAGLLAFLVLYPIGWLVLESVRDDALTVFRTSYLQNFL